MDLHAKLENKSGAESNLILEQEFKLPPQTQFRQKIQQDESGLKLGLKLRLIKARLPQRKERSVRGEWFRSRRFLRR
ncbi:MAG: hypothetical protein JNM39_08070 [Bdellovibrionaceae bacterium]|nr:hypothetical protein [Pseudobdellovibrionaceae bacterium]